VSFNHQSHCILGDLLGDLFLGHERPFLFRATQTIAARTKSDGGMRVVSGFICSGQQINCRQHRRQVTCQKSEYTA
jgi:hypothetical protein